jgi:signal transduction histidine kinase/DNA-binding response OmpR family regulator/ligand-binding sensor domain-containing protein
MFLCRKVKQYTLSKYRTVFIMLSRLFTLLILLQCWLVGWSQPTSYEHIGIEQGLTQGMVFDICASKDGFLWMGTKDGLNRYDGSQFKVYNHNPFDPYSLGEDIINCLYEDSRGLIWIGTANKGVDVFDRKKGRFHHFNITFKYNTNQDGFEVVRIMEDSKGDMWFMQEGKGLAKLTVPKSWATQLPEGADLLSAAQIVEFEFPDWSGLWEILVNLWETPQGDMMVASNLNFYRIGASDTQVSLVPSPGLTGIRLGTAHSKGITWVLGNKNQLICMDDHQTWSQTLPIEWDTCIALFFTDRLGTTWLSVYKKVWKLTPFQRINPAMPDYTVDRIVESMAVDRSNNVWIGTTGYGLRKIKTGKSIFKKGGVGTSIWRMWKSPHNRYLVGLYGRIFDYDAVSCQISTRPTFPEHPDLSQRGIHFEPSGAFWMLAVSKPENGNTAFLYYYDEKGKMQETHPLNLNAYQYTLLQPDNNGDLWATGAGCHLARFNRQRRQVTYFDYSAAVGNDPNTVLAFDVAQDANGDYWIGTQRGLIKMTLKNGTTPVFKHFSANSDNPKGLNNNVIAALLPDPSAPSKVLWIGTKGGGINRMDIATEQITHIGVDQGLPDKTVYGILAGNEDPTKGPVSIWCSTNRGLSKVLPLPDGGYSFTNYIAENGLQDNEFNTQAFFKAPDGELLFGGINGLNYFYPEQLLPDTASIPVYIVGIDVKPSSAKGSAQNGTLAFAPEHTQMMQLAYDQNDITFEFAAIQFTAPDKIRYRYKMEGLADEWTEARNSRFAEFHNLVPGNYRFLVQASNGEGTWFDAQPISIVIAPPWWRSTFAYFCYFALLVAAFVSAYRFEKRRLSLKEQLSYEQRETERIKAVEQMKTNFFNNMAHEFRTPLTLILEPARRIMGHSKEEKTIEYAQMVENNGQQLFELVNQLLDLAKLESGHMTLDLRMGDFGAILQELYRSFLPLAEQQQIALHLDVPPNLPLFAFDHKKTTLVLNNLLSNALKFNQAGGSVHVSCSITNAHCILRCADTGIGMDHAALDHVFQRYFRANDDTKQAGTGIGLSLSKELAEHMRGRLEATSEVGKGSVFEFWLPLGFVQEPTTQQGQARVPTLATPPVSAHPDDMPIALVVEDNAEMRRFIADCIRGQWRVEEASNGAEGIRMAQELVPNIVISDVMMPERDGLELCNALKTTELTAHIPVILLTAKAGTENRIKGLQYGADDYLIKPFHTEELLARMDNLVRTRLALQHYFEGGQPDRPQPSSAAVETLPPLSQLDMAFIEKINLLLDERLADEDLNVEAAAAHLYVSRVQLHRKLKAITGQHFTDYLRNYRLDRALHMLRNREGKVYEVSFKTGFTNDKHFSRVFKEKFGFSPSQV